MATHRALIDATNQAFWDITNYKPGQRLDMSDPQDRDMARRWLDIYKEFQEYRLRGFHRAYKVLQESMQASRTVEPYVLVVEIPDGRLTSQTFPSRANLDVQYKRTIDQTENYTYAAMFDFEQKIDGLIADMFATVRRQQIAARGWYA